MDKLALEIQYIQHELQTHVGTVFPEVVGVLTTPAALRRYAPAFAPFAESQLRIFETPQAIEREGLGVLVVVGDGLWPTLSLTAKVRDPKVADLPIVSCTPDRRFARNSPPPQIGLDYAGMFWLASQYLPMIRGRSSYVEFGVFDG